MGPKKRNAGRDSPDGLSSPKYQRFFTKALTVGQAKLDSSVAFDAANMVFGEILNKYDGILKDRRMNELMAPYVAEAGLSVALTPSVMLLYE